MLCCVLAAGCANAFANAFAEAIVAETDAPAEPWTSLDARDEPEDFHFVVVTDRTGGHRPGVFASAMPKVNLLSPAFVVSVGDLIEGYTDNQEQLDREWDEMEGFIAQLDAPFFYTPGNHDMSNAVMAETWRQRFGPSYYHFLYKDVLFVVLNSELFGMVGQPDVPLPGPWQQQEQMQFIENVLDEHRDARWTIVLLHQPLWDSEEIDPDWLEVESLLGSRDYTVFAGHYHSYTKARRHDRSYITLATTGGGSGLRGLAYGEFDHVAWVTMTADGPRIANLMLDGIHDENVRTLATRDAVEALAEAVTVVPELADEALFLSDRQRVRLENPGTADLRLVPTVSTSANFDIGGLAPVTLAPGETRDMVLELENAEPVPYRDLEPAAVQWALATRVGAQPVQMTITTTVMPLTRHPIPRAERAPTIDGDLDDWPALPYAAHRQGDLGSPATAPGDVSFRFGVQHDEDHLYVAVEVVDDSIVQSPERLARNQDAIAVAVDARAEPLRNASMGIGEAVLGGTLAEMTATFLTLEESPAEDTLLGFLDDVNERVTRAVRRTERGYRAELAIPAALLDAQAGERWRDARIGVHVYDFDEDESGSVMLHWQPYRFGSAPLAGTYTFRRSD